MANAPSYQQTFSEVLGSDTVRFPAVTDKQLFDDAVNVGRRLLKAWKLETPPRGHWTQQTTGTRLGGVTLLGDHAIFANDDRLDGLHPKTAEFEVSTYRVFERFLQARAHLELSTELGLYITKLAGAIAVILDEEAVCDALLTRALAAPSTGW